MIQIQAVWLQSLDSSTPRSIQTHRDKDYIPENRVHAMVVADENRENLKYAPSTTPFIKQHTVFLLSCLQSFPDRAKASLSILYPLSQIKFFLKGLPSLKNISRQDKPQDAGASLQQFV